MPVPQGCSLKIKITPCLTQEKTMNTAITRSIVALLLSLAIVQLPFALEAKDAGYSVIYDGGSLPDLKSGSKLKMNIDSHGIRFMDDKGKSPVTTVVPSTAPEVSYGQHVHRRGGTAVAVRV